MTNYYAERLSAERLRRCYDIAPPRVQRYFEAEVGFALARIAATDAVLELGCGYGRILEDLAPKARTVTGIDTSISSLRMARQQLEAARNCRVAQMDAAALGFSDQAFDVVLCLQNGLSAFKVDRRAVIRECIRVTRPGGSVLLSSYSSRFWDDRLGWFRLQSKEGLLGEIDIERTGGGVIVCRDSFSASTIGRAEFESLTSTFDVRCRIEEVDGSSLFCEITAPGPAQPD